MWANKKSTISNRRYGKAVNLLKRRRTKDNDTTERKKSDFKTIMIIFNFVKFNLRFVASTIYISLLTKAVLRITHACDQMLEINQNRVKDIWHSRVSCVMHNATDGSFGYSSILFLIRF